MSSERKRGRMLDVLMGGVLGAFAALAALRRRRQPHRTTTAGLAAFEDAPCFREALLGEQSSRRRRR